jgi:hypothetical protein
MKLCIQVLPKLCAGGHPMASRERTRGTSPFRQPRLDMWAAMIRLRSPLQEIGQASP